VTARELDELLRALGVRMPGLSTHTREGKAAFTEVMDSLADHRRVDTKEETE
jgi:hypothetical protein